MMEDNMLYAEREKDIDVKDLMVRFLVHWKSLLVLMIIGGLLGGALGYKMARKEQIKANTPVIYSEQQDAAAEKADANNTKTTVSEGKLYEVTSAMKMNMELAQAYRKIYNIQKEYADNSIIMKIDPNHVYQGEIGFYFDGAEVLELVLERFDCLCDDEEALARICASAEGVPSEYIREVISIGLDKGNETIISADEPDRDAIVHVTVSHYDKTALEPIYEAIKEECVKILEEFKSENPDFTYVKLDDHIRVKSIDNYATIQKNKADIAANSLSYITKYEGLITGEDLNYYKTMYNSDITIPTAEQETEQDAEQEAEVVVEQTNVPLNTKTVLKWVAVGVILLMCCWIGVIFLSYALDGKIKTADELKSMYGLKVVGYISSEKKKRGLDGLIQLLQEKIRPVPVTEEYLRAMCAEFSDQNTMQIGYHTEAGFAYNSIETLKKAKNADGVFLKVGLNSTTYKELDRELEIVEIQGIRILGVIVTA